MQFCASCETRRATRDCHFLGKKICPVCCIERHRISASCPSECHHSNQHRQEVRASVGKVAANNGAWLTPRIKAFSVWEEIYTAVLDLEETIWYFTRTGGEITDMDVLKALDYLAGKKDEEPGELASWLEESLWLDNESDYPGECYPPLLMLGLLPEDVRRNTLFRLRDIVAMDAANGCYLERVSAYFTQLEDAEGGRILPGGLEKGLGGV